MWCKRLKCEQQRSSKVIVALRAMRTCLQQILPSWWGIALHYSNYTPHRSRQHWSTYSKNRKLINTHLRIERSFKSPPPSHIYLETHMYGYIGGHCMQNTFTTLPYYTQRHTSTKQNLPIIFHAVVAGFVPTLWGANSWNCSQSASYVELWTIKIPHE